MNFTHSILEQMGYKLDSDGNYSRTETCPKRIPDTKPECLAGEKLLDSGKPQKKSRKRITLRITRYATRLLDEDNLGGSKLLTDQLRYAGIIPNDDPGSTKIILDQIKVSTKAEERTEIEIKEN